MKHPKTNISERPPQERYANAWGNAFRNMKGRSKGFDWEPGEVVIGQPKVEREVGVARVQLRARYRASVSLKGRRPPVNIRGDE